MRADIVFRGARLIDGTGTPSQSGDLAVIDERIVAMGDLRAWSANVEIDASDGVLAPGFIDSHTHDDRALLSAPLMKPKVSQGVTTVVVGNCGLSVAPLRGKAPPLAEFGVFGEGDGHWFADFGDYIGALKRDPAAVNAACLVGHSTLRAATMDSLDRPANDREIEAMRAELERALEAGATGLSTCMADDAARAAPTAEVVAIGAVLAAHRAFYCTHLRNEANTVTDALEEAFEIGRSCHAPVQVAHHKCAGLQNFGRSKDTLALLDRARSNLDVAIDAYPYAAASTVLHPDYIHDATRTIVAWSGAVPEAAGRDLAVLATEWGCSLDAASERLQPASAIYFMMDEADVRRILAHPHTMIGSDGLPHDPHPHPRLWGAFARVLGHYARDVGLFTLEEAVRRMTGLPAARFGFSDRGALRPGAFADLVLFHPDQIIDKSTFEKPVQPCAGIELVAVNGQIVFRDGAHTEKRPGRVLTGTAAAR